MDLKCEKLDALIEDCLVKIFKLLTLEDLFNVAETCTKFESVADDLFRKHSTFVVDSSIVQTGPNNINRILKHTGRHIKSLEIRFCSDEVPCSAVLDLIECSKLKELKIFHLKSSCENVFTSHSFDNLELFTACTHNFPNLKTLLAGLNKLKCLNIQLINIDNDDLILVLRNNPNMESFVYSGHEVDFNCQLLEMIPKVQKLALCFETGTLSNVNLLPACDYLTALQINCQKVEISTFLSRLPKPKLLKELELHCIREVNLPSLLKVIRRFDNLELLHLDALVDDDVNDEILTNPIVWPPSIKRLYLHNIFIYRKTCISTIRQLKSLEQFDAL